jgi:integral membrane sensor domain MASE1
LPGPLLALLVAVVYGALAQFVILLNDPVYNGAGFWPAAGFSLGVLLLLPERKWGWVLVGIAVAEFGGDTIGMYPMGASALWTLGNCVEPLVGAILIRRFTTFDGTLAPVRNLVGFVGFGVIAGPLVGATIGSLGSTLFADGVAVWPKYFVGDALGALVVAPLLLVGKQQHFPHRSTAESVAIVISSVAVSVLIFRNWGVAWDVFLPYAIFPFLIWAALRFGTRGGVWLSFLVAQIANWATAMGYGPFSIPGGAGDPVTMLQGFLAVVIGSTLILAAVVEDLVDSREVERLLHEHNRELSATVGELKESHLYIRKLEGILPICMTCNMVRADDDKSWLALDRYVTQVDAFKLSHTLCPACEEREMELV